MKILLVEDDQQTIETCKESASLYENDSIEIVSITSLSDNLIEFIGKVDFAIVDMTLNGDGQAGNTIINRMNTICSRIPTVIYTGTPDECDNENVLKVFKKTEKCNEIFDFLYPIYQTGITEIIGHKGYLEKIINKYYQEVFIQQKELWIEKTTKVDPGIVKKALLRSSIYHIEELLNDPYDKALLEEFYVINFDTYLKPGQLFKKKDDSKYFILLTPACDLVERTDKQRNQKYSIDNLTFCEIESIEKIGYKECSSDDKTMNKEKRESAEKRFSNLGQYYQWLPPYGKVFKGGVVNFEKVFSEPINKIDHEFEKLKIKVADPYIKNIVSRFSSCFARQGQPDLMISLYSDKIVKIEKVNE